MQEIQSIEPAPKFTTAHLFGAGFLVFAAGAAIVIGSFPLQLSIISIFLFAGVHNFMEFRYFLARMPVRWGRSKTFYATGIGGVAVLTSAYLLIYFGAGNWLWSLTSFQLIVSLWNTSFILWIALLFYLRGRQKPKADWSWAFPVGFLICALAWLAPNYWSLSLVYLHPLIAMWFLERQMRRTRPEWLKAYRTVLVSIPFLVAGLYFAFADAPNLSTETNLFWRITQHAGSEILPGISSHFLVAAHVFLETIHYVVWIFLIPLVDFRAIPWKIKEIPLFSNRKGFPKFVLSGLIVSFLLVLTLWAAFSIDYTFARDLYFAFAMAHVLAEFPFLVKML